MTEELKNSSEGLKNGKKYRYGSYRSKYFDC